LRHPKALSHHQELTQEERRGTLLLEVNNLFGTIRRSPGIYPAMDENVCFSHARRLFRNM